VLATELKDDLAVLLEPFIDLRISE